MHGMLPARSNYLASISIHLGTLGSYMAGFELNFVLHTIATSRVVQPEVYSGRLVWLVVNLIVVDSMALLSLMKFSRLPLPMYQYYTVILSLLLI